MAVPNLRMITTVARNNGLTLQEVADRVGISRQQLHRIISKNDCKVSMLLRICEVLHIDVTDIIQQSWDYNIIIDLKKRVETLEGAITKLIQLAPVKPKTGKTNKILRKKRLKR